MGAATTPSSRSGSSKGPGTKTAALPAPGGEGPQRKTAALPGPGGRRPPNENGRPSWPRGAKAPKRKRPPFLGGRIEKLFGLFVVEPSAGSSAGSLQVHRLRTARVGLDFEAHLLAFDQRGHPRALDRGDMDAIGRAHV